MSKKMVVVFPSRNFKFSGIYNVTEDLHNGLEKEKIDHDLLLVVLNNNYVEPSFQCKKVTLSEFKTMFSNSEYYLIPDDYELVDYLHDNSIFGYDIVIWSHYFKGHRMIFSEYNDKVMKKNFFELSVSFVHNFMPYLFWKFFVRKYVDYLKKNVLISQSIWSCLLLNRVYSLNCQRIISLPIEPKYFRENNAVLNQALIFLGGKLDTDLLKLHHVLMIIKKTVGNIHYQVIGDKQTYELFTKTNQIDASFLANVSRSDLQDIIAKMKFTINPIFLGTFEMFPIESLMCGTPVITYIQPFLEVVGESRLVSYIHSDNDIKQNLIIWLNNSLEEEKKRIRAILELNMRSNKIAREIYKLFESEFQ
jgi:glycosyltransferase involved in cell wall biosynthesis